MKLAYLSAKGGVGKSTLSAYTSMALHKEGLPVIGVDLDPQLSWLKWHKTGALPYQVVEGKRHELAEQLESLGDCIVIDSPPNDLDIIYEIAELATHVIIPLQPSGMDISRLASSLKPVVRELKHRPELVAKVLLNEYSRSLNVAKEAVELLEGQGVPLLKSRVRDLARYKSLGTPSYLREFYDLLYELEVL